MTSSRELQLILTTSEQPKDDLKDTPGAFGLVSLTQIIKTKGTAMLLKGADSLDLFSCYLWGAKKKLDIVQLECDTGWKFKKEWKNKWQGRSNSSTALLYQLNLWVFTVLKKEKEKKRERETGLRLVRDAS